MNSVFEILKKINIKGSIRVNEDMSRHSTFKCGGEAEIFVEAKDIDDVVLIKKAALKYNFPLFILGGGANILVSDSGIKGVTLSLEGLNKISKTDDGIEVEAGLSVNEVSEFAYKNSLSGMEFIYGMPGSIGGALYMNARCYGEEISEKFIWADYLDKDANLQRVFKNDKEWAYKISPFQENGIIILRASLSLDSGNKSIIKEKMDLNFKDRRDKGHFKYPCAGSVFKNNRDFGAPSGKIIEDVGLKGIKKGDAQISDFHANIIVNLGNAKASDINFLIQKVIFEVNRQTGFILEPEVLKVGSWED